MTQGRVETVELDVQIASDGTVVISHDPNTARCFGEKHDIASTPYAGVLDRLLVTERPAYDGTGDEAAWRKLYKMPTFREVAELFARDERFAQTQLMVDVKLSNDVGVIARLVSVLRDVQPDLKGFWAQRTVFGIWRLDVLEEAKRVLGADSIPVCFIGVSRSLARKFIERGVVEKPTPAPAAPSGGTASASEDEDYEYVGARSTSSAQLGDSDEETAVLLRRKQNPAATAPSTPCKPTTARLVQAISLNRFALLSAGSTRLLREARAQGILVYMWTANSPDDMKWCIASDLAGVITDYPDRYAQLRTDMEEESGGGNGGEDDDDKTAILQIGEPAQYVKWADWNIKNVAKYYLLKTLFSLIVYIRIDLFPAKKQAPQL